MYELQECLYSKKKFSFSMGERGNRFFEMLRAMW